MPRPAEDTITEKTRIPLALAYAAVALAVVITAKGTWHLARIEGELRYIRQHVQADWVLADQVIWSRELADRNRTLIVPRPEECRALAQHSP